MQIYEEKFTLIQKVIENCSISIDVLALSEDNTFIGEIDRTIRCFVVSPYCNSKYTWHSSLGSIQDRGPINSIPSSIKFVDDVIGGQLEFSW